MHQLALYVCCEKTVMNGEEENIQYLKAYIHECEGEVGNFFYKLNFLKYN